MERPKAYFERDLSEPVTVPAHDLGLRSFADVGEREFAAVMVAAAVGDPFDTTAPEDALDDLRALVASAGTAFDPDRWFVAELDGEPVGVLLPQPYPHDPTTGTLFYVAVMPDRRGAGYGRLLHAIGLEVLATRGVERYVGSTDVTNAAMLGVFRANGCRRSDLV